MLETVILLAALGALFFVFHTSTNANIAASRSWRTGAKPSATSCHSPNLSWAKMAGLASIFRHLVSPWSGVRGRVTGYHWRVFGR